MKFLILLIFVSLSFSRTLTYGVKVFWFEVGKIKITITKDRAVAEGRTYKSFEWLYKYNFKFIQEKGKILLLEKENGKERIYEGRKVYEKKPWIPVVVEYLRNGRIRENGMFKIKREGDRLIVLPTKSKKLKKIIIYGKGIPKKIEIRGKITITLILKDVKENKGTFRKRRLETFGRTG